MARTTRKRWQSTYNDRARHRRRTEPQLHKEGVKDKGSREEDNRSVSSLRRFDQSSRKEATTSTTAPAVCNVCSEQRNVRQRQLLCLAVCHYARHLHTERGQASHTNTRYVFFSTCSDCDDTWPVGFVLQRPISRLARASTPHIQYSVLLGLCRGSSGTKALEAAWAARVLTEKWQPQVVWPLRSWSARYVKQVLRMARKFFYNAAMKSPSSSHAVQRRVTDGNANDYDADCRM